MNFVSSNIEIDSGYYQEDHCLYFKFKGKFTEAASILSTKSWHQEMSQNPFIHYVFVWDCEEMTGFELSARKLWYEYMNMHKTQIDRVVVISKSILIRNAAKVMLEFFRLNATVVKSREKFLELSQPAAA